MAHCDLGLNQAEINAMRVKNAAEASVAVVCNRAFATKKCLRFYSLAAAGITARLLEGRAVFSGFANMNNRTNAHNVAGRWQVSTVSCPEARVRVLCLNVKNQPLLSF
jgi:hypothetical protein